MEPYYYQKMNKPQQAAYHAMQQGVLALADEIQLPRIPAEELYDVFFRLRLDHPEIFWVVSYRYRYYQDSPNIIFVPEYLFEKNKIREHQKAMQSWWKSWQDLPQSSQSGKKRSTFTTLSAKISPTIS